MALQGNGPEKKTPTLLVALGWGEISSPSQSSPRPPSCTVGDGGHDGLLSPLASAAHCPHHVSTITVGADDALPALLPGQAL